MCTRIFNNINIRHLVTGRNMDWNYPVDAYLYRFPKNNIRSGIDKSVANSLDLRAEQILTWHTKYETISQLITSPAKQKYATADGMNDQGLVVNALYDSSSTYSHKEEIENKKVLSSLRWAQYILDCFATVSEAITAFSKQDIFIYPENVPDKNSVREGLFHIALSDATGNSGVIEVKNGRFQLYENKQYSVVTNQPDYSIQLKLSDYWLYQWNLLPDTTNNSRVLTAPGGFSPVQRFERACFYRYLSSPSMDTVAQTKAMVSTCSIPIQLNPDNVSEDDVDTVPTSCTNWTNLADSTNKQYYYQSTYSMGSLWLNFSTPYNENKRVFLTDNLGQSQTEKQYGNIDSELVLAKDPYAI